MDDVEEAATEDLSAKDMDLPDSIRLFPVLLGIEGTLKNQRFTLDKEAVLIGRDMGADILLKDPKTSRWHTRVVYENFGEPNESPRCRVFDVGSTNGTHVNKERVGVEGRLLEDKDRIRVGRSVFGFFLRDADEVSLDRKLEEMATRDPVTGLLNLHVFRRIVHRETVRAKRYRRDLSLLLIDVDALNDVNTTHGRPAGDAVLHHIASLLKQFCRTNDLIARHTSDEIALLLPETNITGANLVAQRIGRAIRSEPIPYGAKKISVTVCVAMAGWSWEIESADALLQRAENALHQAQEKGSGSISPATADAPESVEPETRL